MVGFPLCSIAIIFELTAGTIVGFVAFVVVSTKNEDADTNH